MPETTRIDNQIGFILDTQPWKESSLLIDIFTQYYGRKTLIARSAKKAHSNLRGTLTPFVPISFSWFGKNNLLTLYQANWIGGYSIPQGISLLSSWYINELILKLVPLDDPYPKLFNTLNDTMQSLGKCQNPISELRKFEWVLLNELGFAPCIMADINNQPIQDNQWYQILPESNLIPIQKKLNHQTGILVSGHTLINISNQNYMQETTQREARIFFQFLLKQYIPSNQIVSSKILKQLFAILKIIIA